MTTARRSIALVILSTLVLFLVLVVLLELGLRLLLGAALPGVETNPVIGTFRSASEIRLAPNPQFVTDANGFWVANASRAGVNADGYRSPPLDEDARGRKTLLILGDSFTWGMSAEPLSEAFPDQIRRAGYKVCNLGIPGIATVQYRAQVEHYVPRLRPDAVCLFFYSGNDFLKEPPIVPGRPRNYETNIAEIRALGMDGEPIDFENARQRFAGRYGTGLWSSLQRQFEATGISLFARAWHAPDDEDLVTEALDNLQAIASTCEANGAKFLLFLLPTRAELRTPLSEAAEANLSAFTPRTIQGILPEHYAEMPDAHFTNAGHDIVATYALDQLKQAGL